MYVRLHLSTCFCLRAFLPFRLALPVHEKGKVLLNGGKPAEALELFVWADHAFQLVSAQLLACVDNAALVSLDIAWCVTCTAKI